MITFEMDVDVAEYTEVMRFVFDDYAIQVKINRIKTHPRDLFEIYDPEDINKLSLFISENVWPQVKV